MPAWEEPTGTGRALTTTWAAERAPAAARRRRRREGDTQRRLYAARRSARTALCRPGDSHGTSVLLAVGAATEDGAGPGCGGGTRASGPTDARSRRGEEGGPRGASAREGKPGQAPRLSTD